MCDKRLCACRKKTKAIEEGEEESRSLEDAYASFQRAEGSSLLKKHLTREIFDRLKTRRTGYGSRLLDVVRSGLANPDSSVGLYAPDPEAYDLFAELFDPVIEEYHGHFLPGDVHPELDWGEPRDLGNLDPEGKYVISTRIRCARSIEGYPFNPTMSEHHYREVESKVCEALSSLEGELAGTYHALGGMDKETQQRLVDEHFLFKEGDRFLEAANANGHWPIGRGIFFNENKTFLVWCNEEDHVRLISMEKGGDLSAVYERLVKAVQKIGRKVEFTRHRRLGFLTFCPTNLGTTVRASVHVRLPKLSADYPRFEEIAARYDLQIRGTRGEHSESEGGVYDISNKRRLGLTEKEALLRMSNGIRELIVREKALEQDQGQDAA
ncbi:hypothetical protein KM043_004892 [Ampulex compressa]|nr:hypothetical protein KM043_004892 [Ampulex compressa]